MSDPRLRVIRHADGEEQRLLAALDEPTIEIRILGGLPSWRHQVLAICLVDLLGRIFPRIRASADPSATAHPALPPGERLLLARLEAARHRGIGPAAPREASVIAAIGVQRQADIHVDGDGWISYVGSAPSQLPGTDSLNPVGPLLAAARAAGRVFAVVLRDFLSPAPPATIVSSYSSALTFASSAEPIAEEGGPVLDPTVDAIQVGAGSVGGSCLYLLAQIRNLAGQLDVVDPQDLEPPNFVRALLAPRVLADGRVAKVTAAAEALAHLESLVVRPHQQTMAEFVAARPRDQRLPLVLSPVDSVSARRQIQDCLPLELINAACDGTDACVSGHVTDDGPCVYCLHLPEVLDAARIRERLISERLALPQMAVRQLLATGAPLSPQQLADLERRNAMAAGALSHHAGHNLDEVYAADFLYGEVAANSPSGARVAVSSPYLTALTGFLLGSELLKASAGEGFARYRLGPSGTGTRYRESLLHGPMNSLLDRVPRWPGNECLCRSTRRVRLLRERYGLASVRHPALSS